MSEDAKILQELYEEGIRSQPCAICGQSKQRVVRQKGRPDYALCDACGAVFVLEDGGGMRMMYGRIADDRPKVQAFALKQWRRYHDIKAVSESEQAEKSGQQTQKSSGLPYELEILLNQGGMADSTQALLDLEAQQSQLFYDRAKKLEPPPRPLRETGDLPDLDSLFKE